MHSDWIQVIWQAMSPFARTYAHLAGFSNKYYTTDLFDRTLPNVIQEITKTKKPAEFNYFRFAFGSPCYELHSNRVLLASNCFRDFKDDPDVYFKFADEVLSHGFRDAEVSATTITLFFTPGSSRTTGTTGTTLADQFRALVRLEDLRGLIRTEEP